MAAQRAPRSELVHDCPCRKALFALCLGLGSLELSIKDDSAIPFEQGHLPPGSLPNAVQAGSGVRRDGTELVTEGSLPKGSPRFGTCHRGSYSPQGPPTFPGPGEEEGASTPQSGEAAPGEGCRAECGLPGGTQPTQRGTPPGRAGAVGLLHSP